MLMRDVPSDPKRGVTLLELVVVLALLGVIFAVSSVALGSLRQPGPTGTASELRAARRQAIQSGIAQRASGALFLPDGRAFGVGVDPLTGAVLAQ